MNNAPPLYNFSYSNQRLLQKPYSIQNQLSYPFGYASLIQGARNRRTQTRHLISAYNTRVPTFPGNVVSRDLHPMMMMHTASVPASRGLELLRAASLQVPKRQIPKPSACVSAEPLKASASNNTATSKKKKKRIPKPSARNDKAPSKSKQGLVYIDKILESDILCGRGGRSNHHAGNKKFRQVVSEMKADYRSTDYKKAKTKLSLAIVDHVREYGGRFIKKDAATGQYYILDNIEARKKTSQALRETKTLKWTL